MVFCQSLGLDPVVAVHESDTISPRLVKSGITRGRQSSVRFMNDADAIIFRRPHITFARASIAGAIIDEDDFQVAIALLDNALDTLIKIPFHVVDGNDHADQ